MDTNGRKPFPLLAWFLQAFAGIVDLFTSRKGEESIADTIMDDNESYTRYAFPPEKAALAGLVADVETTVFLGYDTDDGSLVLVAAKPDVDTATIDFEVPKSVIEIRAMRPDLFGQVIVSMQNGGGFIESQNVVRIMKGLVAGGFLPVEGYNGRPIVTNTAIEAMTMPIALNTGKKKMGRFGLGTAMKLGGDTVRFASVHHGRVLLVTDKVAILTRRMNAMMLLEIVQQNGNIPDEYVYDAKKVGLDSPPLNVVKTGTGVVIGLCDEATNIAIGISPTGKFEVEMQVDDALGALTSLFASIAEQSTGTAIVTRDDGTLGRTPLAAFTPRFRQIAGIALEGNGAGKTTRLQA